MKQVLQQQSDPNLLLLPKINEYLLQHGNEKFSTNAMKTVFDALTTPPRNRTASFSSSSAGTDLRHQELAFLGYPQSQTVMPDLHIIFMLGHWAHAMTQGLLLSANLIQDIEVPVGDPEFYSKGSMDGEGYVWWDAANPKWRDQPFILEAKTVGQWAWDKKVKLGKPSEDHLAQIHRYMLLTGIRLCSYLMLNKGGGNEGMVEFVVEADQKLLDKSKRELEELKKAVETQTLHPQSDKCRIGLSGCIYGGKKGFCGTVKDWVPFDKSMLKQ
jgi:hypothetical protein